MGAGEAPHLVRVHPAGRARATFLPQKPGWAPLDPHNVYAADAPGDLARRRRRARPLVYVPNSESDTVDEIDPHTFRIVRQFAVGALPQHVIPSYDLRTLWVANDEGNSLTPIDPVTGVPGRPIPVEDPYNMYFTPDGRYAVVVAERLRRTRLSRRAHDEAAPLAERAASAPASTTPTTPPTVGTCW